MLATQILNNEAPASAAMGRSDVYDALNAGTNGPLGYLSTSVKIDASKNKVGVLTAVLYMQPADESGREACAGRSEGCTTACLAEGTGRMSFSGPQTARRRRHAAFYADRKRFLADLHVEVGRHRAKALRKGYIPAIRLNGTTDLPWHRMPYVAHDGMSYPSLHAAYPGVQFYEYTKMPYSIMAKGGIPANLHLTFSLSERDDAEPRALEYLKAGYGCAVVAAIRKHDVPPTFSLGSADWPTVDGDDHDARFLDPSGSVVILAAKGRAKRDTSGFTRYIV